MEGLGIAHADGIYMAKKSRFTASPTLLEIGPHLGCPERGTHGECYYASLRGIQCNAQRFLYRSHTHSWTPQSGEQKRPRTKQARWSTSFHIWRRRFECRGLLNTSSDVCMMQRLPVAQIGFSAVWKLHCIASGTFCRSTSRSRMQADEIRH